MNLQDQLTAFNAQQMELQRQRAQLGDDAARLAGELAVERQRVAMLMERIQELTKQMEKKDDTEAISGITG